MRRIPTVVPLLTVLFFIFSLTGNALITDPAFSNVAFAQKKQDAKIKLKKSAKKKNKSKREEDKDKDSDRGNNGIPQKIAALQSEIDALEQDLNNIELTPGPQGDTGATGPQGPAGNNGANGAVGPQGPAGNDGANGLTGPIGPQGPAGNDGAAGANGVAGATGTAGPAGNDGANGADGAQGIQGLAGNNGANGAVGPQGPAGTNGTNGANGTDGTDGAKGDTGAQGSQGPAGNDGAAGANGVAGATGPAGPTGPAGANGSDGANGADGAQGIQGLQGPAGPPPSPQDLYKLMSQLGVSRTWFISSIEFTGNLGGLNGADQKCQMLADSSTSIAPPGTYKAYLSTTSADAISRLNVQSSAPIIDTRYSLIASNMQSFMTEGRSLTRDMYDQTGTISAYATGSGHAWTNTDGHGARTETGSGERTCGDWTATAGPVPITGRVGQTNAFRVTNQWARGGYQQRPCDQSAHLYCIQQ